jgi:hypothetical protein
VEIGRGWMGGKGMVVGNEEKTLIFFLHPDKALQSPEVVSEVKVSCGTYSAYNYSHYDLRFTIYDLRLKENAYWLLYGITQSYTEFKRVTQRISTIFQEYYFNKETSIKKLANLPTRQLFSSPATF